MVVNVVLHVGAFILPTLQPVVAGKRSDEQNVAVLTQTKKMRAPGRYSDGRPMVVLDYPKGRSFGAAPSKSERT